MVLQNFIRLEPGVPAVIHAVADRIINRDIADPLTGVDKTITLMEFDVDELNGKPVNATWSVTSEKLAQQLQPLTVGKQYLTLNLIVTKNGTGFQTEYTVTTSPRR